MKKLSAVFFILFLICLAWFYWQESQKILAMQPTAWTKDVKADCAVVVTGGPSRVREGFDLLSNKVIKKLIISGTHPGAKLREIFPQWPFYGNLNQLDVILEKRSKTTWGNAQQSLAFVEALHCRDVILITSTLHMYRALKSFEAVFPKDLPIYPRSIVARRFHPPLFDILFETTKSLFYSSWLY